MTPACEKVLEHLGQGPLPAELAAHARSCPFCAARLAVLGDLPAPSAPAPNATVKSALRDAVLKELAAHPVAPPWWREPVLLSGLCLAAVVLAVLWLGRHGPLVNNQASAPGLLITGALLFGVLLWGAFGAFAPGGRWLRNGLIAFSLEAAAVVALAGSGLDVPKGAFLAAGTGCALTEFGTSAVPLAITLWMLTRVAYQPQRAFAAGLTTGAVGMLALHLHCPCGALAHLALFHVVPWLALAGLAILIRSLLPSRTYAP